MVGLFLLTAVSLAADSSSSEPGDWPQFHGPHRDAQCAETGLLQEWPEGGPKLLWKTEGLGKGYSTVSIAGGRILTMGDRRGSRVAGRPAGDESQFVIALIEATPEEFRIKGTFRTAVKLGNSWPHPVIHNGELYLRDQDVLMCYDVAAR